jgi:hypothetical protein
MSLLNKEIKGYIGYFNLEEWWENEFTVEEKETILKLYELPPSENLNDYSKNLLTELQISETSESRLQFVSNMATWFNKPESFILARKILEKADEFITETQNILDIHFHYQHKIEIFYRNRETGDALYKAIEACEQQISISDDSVNAFKIDEDGIMPSHKGYEQLAIIKYKQMDYEAVISLCTRALQQGWAGNWEKRIEKAKKGIMKSQNN